MNKGVSKHYSLLFQDDTEFSEDILSIHNVKMSDEDEDDDDDDGFKSMIGEDIGCQDDLEDLDGSEEVDEVYGSDEEIFSHHRPLSNEGLRLANTKSFGRKNEYRLLTNGEIDQKPLAFEAPLSTIWTPTPMSPVRRAFFLASIMLGVLVVAMFLWALPCDVQPCKSKLHIGPRQWFREIDNVGINYTRLFEKINGDLSLFLSYYEVERFSETNSKLSDNQTSEANLMPRTCGLLRLDENLGKEHWRFNLEECPRVINCQLMDSTGDGLLDCLILGYNSLAIMVEPIYGGIFWHVHFQTKSNTSLQSDELHFDLPLLLQDLDYDGFNELLFPVVSLSSDLEDSGNSHLVLVSGRTGSIIGNPFSFSNCHRILKIYKEDVSIGYSCSMENGIDLVGKIPLAKLLNEISKPFDRNRFNDTLQLKTAGMLPEANEAVCQIKYTNQGKCPYCKTRIEMGLTSESPVFKDFEYSSVVSWNILSFGNICKGALLKLWKWDSSSLQKAFIESKPTTKYHSSTQEPMQKDLDLNVPLSNDKNINNNGDYQTEKRKYLRKVYNTANLKSSFGSRIKRYSLSGESFYDHISTDSDPDLTLTKSGDSKYLDIDATLPPPSISPPAGYRLQNLEEVLVLVTFNGSDWLSRDLGSMIVYQLCQSSDCIPSHVSQKDTVLIDLGSVDGTQWNIYVSSSTFSSFREESTNASASWSLESYVRKLIVDVEPSRPLL